MPGSRPTADSHARPPRPSAPRTPRRFTQAAWIIGLVVAVILAIASSAVVPGSIDSAPADSDTTVAPEESSSVVVPDTTITNGSALGLLTTIPIKGKAPKTGYARTAMFGTAWLDVDRNGCDTRNDVLARDLTDITMSGPCTVLTGQLVSPFTGGTIAFVRGNDTSAFVQIDHLVALSNAWQTGAQQLTQQQRVSLANDPINLLAVDGASNSRKGDGDTATWLPPDKSFRCAYAARQISVKATYGLWVTQAEHDAMERVLSVCPEQDAVTSPLAPTAVRYASCSAVRAAGAAPLLAGQPGYEAPRLDRDGDGIAC